jgi:hypothetical protein
MPEEFRRVGLSNCESITATATRSTGLETVQNGWFSEGKSFWWSLERKFTVRFVSPRGRVVRYKWNLSKRDVNDGVHPEKHTGKKMLQVEEEPVISSKLADSSTACELAQEK